MIKYSGQLKDKKLYNVEKVRKHRESKSRNFKPKYNSRCHDIFTLDIECTSAWIQPDGKIIRYTKGISEKDYNSFIPLAIPYIWQFSFNDTVYYGRYFDDIRCVLDDITEALPEDTKLIIWIHNLSYEFMFLSNILTWEKVFAKTPHKPMYAISKEYPNITFKCSYIMSNLSLANWGKQIGLPKMVGDLDYDLMRLPSTPLFDYELEYCERDCQVVYKGILNELKNYDTQFDIPMTSTGKIRRVIKDKLTADPYYVKWIKRLVPSAKMYLTLTEVFAGGYTHANRLHSGAAVFALIGHRDFASSYPTWMVAGKYPCTPWVKSGSLKIPDDKEFENTAYIMHLKFINIKSTKFNTIIQASKCKVRGAKYDNGRVISADYLEIKVTELDWLTIKEAYEWDTVEAIQIWYSRKDYLPKEFVLYILELYNNKTKYKNVAGYEAIYLLSKQYLNSLYGMCVTALCQADVIFNDNNDWEMQPLTMQDVEDRLNKLRDKRPREKRYFLNYSWGVYVTSYARRALHLCLLHKEADYDMDEQSLYCDTDSIYYIDNGLIDWTWYNKYVDKLLRKACRYHGIDFNLTRPADPDGVAHPLGHFDKEPDDDAFITLGAKRYVEQRKGKLYMTVAGINKEAVKDLEDIEDFKVGVKFDKDSENVRKNLCSYLSDMPEFDLYGYHNTYRYGINLRHTGYKLTLADDYEKLIEMMQYKVDFENDYLINTLKKRVTA